jgi:hypothetical protein
MTKLNLACILFVPAARLDSFFVEVPGVPINVYSIMEEIAVPALEPVQPIKIELPPIHEPLPTDLAAPMKALAEKLRVEREGRFEIRKAERIKVALEGWSQDDLPGHQDVGIFRLVVRLRNAGCDSSEAASISEMAIRGSRSSDRSGDVAKAKRAIRTLGL